jgi:hypothetical protein
MSNLNGFPVVHIGLGKTGSTYLQEQVFPCLTELRPEIQFNDPILLELLKLTIRTNITSEEEEYIRGITTRGHNLISYESLVDWNPVNWETAADKNRRLFGGDATIIITVRKTKDYLRSVYQQMVSQGNVRDPQTFFVNSTEYIRQSPTIAPAILSRFDVDSFDLERLYNLYEERFSKVILVPLVSMNNLKFLRTAFNLDNVEMRHLKEKVGQTKHHNVSYSHVAMLLALKRERLLNRLGLMTLGSDISRSKQTLAISEGVKLNANANPHDWNAYLYLLRYRFSWKYFLSRLVDILIPYRKYNLPSDVYSNEDLANRNDVFIEKFASPDDHGQH